MQLRLIENGEEILYEQIAMEDRATIEVIAQALFDQNYNLKIFSNGSHIERIGPNGPYQIIATKR